MLNLDNKEYTLSSLRRFAFDRIIKSFQPVTAYLE